MSPLESLRVAIRALGANALRSALAMLGIVIGVAAVITMIAIGGGAHGRVLAQIRSLGANLLIVTPGSASEGAVRLGAGTRPTLTEDDAAAIAAEVPAVRVATPAVNGSAQLVRGNQNWSTTVVGAVPEHFEARDWRISSGYLFTAREVEHAAKTAVLGATVAERLLGPADPTGATLRIKDVPFQVAGVLARKGNDAAGRDQDDVVFVPLSTARLRLLGGRRDTVDYINVEVASAAAMDGAQHAIEALLRQRHRLAAGAPDDFVVRNMTTVFEAQTAAARNLTLLLAAVAAVSLVAGGINVMNVMLVSVTERTREVGLRLAVGARARDVRDQFLIEATTLCLAGGLAGVALGIGAALALATAFGWGIRITLEVVLLAVGFAAAVGIGSGLYPALRARPHRPAGGGAGARQPAALLLRGDPPGCVPHVLGEARGLGRDRVCRTAAAGRFPRPRPAAGQVVMARDPETDVLVIGSGAGGAAVAWALARAGVAVTVLEAGPRYSYWSDYRLDRPDWEQERFPHKTSRRTYTVAPTQTIVERPELRSWSVTSGADNTTDHRLSWGYQHVQGVGGSTLHYTGEAHRLHPDAMGLRSRFGVGADWPFDYAELEPYYVEAERLIGAAGWSYDPVRWRSAPYPLPPHPLSYASHKLATGFRVLGLNLVPSPLGILSEAYGERPPCNYCANCVRGCPRADKASADVTFIAAALATGRATVVPERQVVHLAAGLDDRVSHAESVDAQGRRHRTTARAFVVAGGAVHTPRLLLASTGAHAPHGLANESGAVGRNFMETVSWVASGLHPEPLGSHRGVPSDAICWDYNAPDAIPGVVGGCRLSVGAGQADLLGPIAYATRLVGGFRRAHKARMREVFGRALTVVGIAECLPNPRAFVDLDPDEADAHGVPLARIHSWLEPGEVERLAFMRECARAVLDATGVESVLEEYGTYDHFAATHVFGTCRMGRDPDTSVVDPSGRSHRWRNLYVADASVFPSSGGGEAPSLTIEALAIRTGRLIAERLRRAAI